MCGRLRFRVGGAERERQLEWRRASGASTAECFPPPAPAFAHPPACHAPEVSFGSASQSAREGCPALNWRTQQCGSLVGRETSTETIDDHDGTLLQSPNDVQRVCGQGPMIFLSASASAWWSAMALTSSGSAAKGEDSRRDAGLVGSEAIATGGGDVTTNHCSKVSCQP